MLEKLIALDRVVFANLNSCCDHPLVDTFFWLLSWFGEGYMMAILGCLGLFLFDRRRFPKNIIVLALILLLNGALVQGIKRVVDRPRPMNDKVLVGEKLTVFSEKEVGPLGISVKMVNSPIFQDKQPFSLRIVGRTLKKNSFPSGHSAAAFGLAICLIYAFRSPLRFLWLFYAAIVAFSRIRVGAHFPLDIATGALIGIVVPYLLLRRTEKYHGLNATRRPYRGPADAPTCIAIVAGEASGDMYGANLVREIKKLSPDAKIFGIGGKKMLDAGLERVHDSKALSIVGVTAVLSAIRTIRTIYKDLLAAMRKYKPQVLICIDLPDFNLMLANHAQSMGVRVVYYISPQIWAWRTGRVHTIADRVDRMIVALPFEVKFYEQVGLPTRFFGHPILESALLEFENQKEACEYFGLDPNRRTVVIAPGSRTNEIKYLVGPLFKAASLIGKEMPELQIVVPLAPDVDEQHLKNVAQKHGFSPIFTRGHFHDLLSIAHFGIITSGTATLEAAIFGCPMLIVYKGSAINAALFRAMIKVPMFGLPNIIAGKMLFPELGQEQVEGDNLARKVLEILKSPAKYGEMAGHCETVRKALTGGETSHRVAGEVLAIASEQIKASNE